jgi:hypothetical protein
VQRKRSGQQSVDLGRRAFGKLLLTTAAVALSGCRDAARYTEADAERVHQYIISVAIEDRLEAEAEAAESTSG